MERPKNVASDIRFGGVGDSEVCVSVMANGRTGLARLPRSTEFEESIDDSGELYNRVASNGFSRGNCFGGVAGSADVLAISLFGNELITASDIHGNSAGTPLGTIPFFNRYTWNCSPCHSMYSAVSVAGLPKPIVSFTHI